MEKELLKFYTYLDEIRKEAYSKFGANNNIAEQINVALQANNAMYCQQAVESRLNNLGYYLVDGEWMKRVETNDTPPVEERDNADDNKKKNNSNND